MNSISTQQERVHGKPEVLTRESSYTCTTSKDHRDIHQPPLPHMATEALSLFYEDKPAFQNVSLPINRQRITALVGPSGCGKTSFLNCLNRLTDLIPKCRVTGRITLDSVDIHTSSTDVVALRSRVGMIFQKPTPFPISIRKNIVLPLAEHGVHRKVDQNQVLEIVLRDVGLWEEVKDRLNTPAVSLSGGQQQRLCIARTLALKPEVILFDEPCSALDPIASGVVEELIANLGKAYTVVIVTHNLPQARRIADFTAFFWLLENTGQLIEYGSTETIFENPKKAITAAYVNGAKG